MSAADITPTDMQWDAIRAIVEWWKGGRSTSQVFYVAGFAGTGKSTVLKIVLQELQRWRMSAHCLMTYMGKASTVLHRKGMPEAMTAHSALYTIDDEVERSAGEIPFVLNRFGPAGEADLLVFDECGQVDGPMGTDASSLGKKILVFGDPGQLPPIRGAGFFTSREPDFFLSEVLRQALESPIVRLATMAREGKQIPFGEWVTEEFGSARVLPLTKRNEHLVLRPETQVLCGVHRVRKVVTAKIRHSRGFGGTRPMAGERSICRKNNREKRLFNGLQGYALTAPEPYRRKAGDDESYSRYETFDVRMDDALKPHTKLLMDPWKFDEHFMAVEEPRFRKNIEWFDFGDVLTVHNAQGSEWPDITLIDDSGSFGEDRHRHRYTGITRASEDLTILRRN